MTAAYVTSGRSAIVLGVIIVLYVVAMVLGSGGGRRR